MIEKRERVFILVCLVLTLVIVAPVEVNSVKKTSPKITTIEKEWSYTYGGAKSDYAYSLIQTADGGFALAGSSGSYSAVGIEMIWGTPYYTSLDDMWLVKTNDIGQVQWNYTYGRTESHEIAHSLIQTSDRGYALAGWNYSYPGSEDRRVEFSLVKTDVNGQTEWDYTFEREMTDPAYSMIQTTDGGYALAGYTSSFGAGETDFWLVKTDVSGQAEWNYTYGGTEDDHAYSMIQTSDRGYALAGSTLSGAGEKDFWLVKTDTNGQVEWNYTCGGVANDVARSLIQTSDGGYALAGSTDSFGAGSDDIWLVKVKAPVSEELTLEFYHFLPFVLILIALTLFFFRNRLKKS